MFFRNDDYVASERALPGDSKRYDDGTQSHKDVRAHVEHEFLVMEREHARIRSEALAAHLANHTDD